MTEEQKKEAEKSFRISIQLLWWIFIIYGNWKRNVIKVGGKPRFHIYDFHLFKPKKSV